MGEQRMWPWKRQTLQWKENLFQHFKWEGLEISPPLQTTQRALTDLQIMTFKPFNKFYCLRDWIQPKNRIWTKNWQLFFMKWTSFQCCATPYVCEKCESNLQILNLLQNPIIPWIVHIFVKIIQGGYVQIGNREDTKFNSQIWSKRLF